MVNLTKDLTSENQFLASLVEEVIADCYKIQSHNTDYLRFPPGNTGAWLWTKGWLKERLVRLAAARGFVYVNGTSAPDISRRLTKILASQAEFGAFYQLLADEPSRRQVVMLLAFSVLGNQRVKLPQNTPEFWNAVVRIDDELLKQARTIPVAVNKWHLDLYDLKKLGVPIRLHAHRLNILDTFLLEQYRYNKGGVTIAVEPGDMVLDAGGCWGDSALYFANLAGAGGRVFCFEFTPANLAIMEGNLDLNPDLREHITVVEKAVWDTSGEPLAYLDQGPGTSLSAGGASNVGAVAQTTTLDDFVTQTGVARVDFIKMDIEGAELRALHGAEATLRKFRPKLAIALYHKWDDFITIPHFIDSLQLGYEFYLDHFTIHQEETVLFARPVG